MLFRSIAVGTVGLAGTGLAAGTHLGGQVAKNYEIFNKTYLEMKKFQSLLSKTNNARDIANLERQIQQLGKQAMKSYNNFQRLSKLDPRYLNKQEYRTMQIAAKDIAKYFKIDIDTIKNVENLKFPKIKTGGDAEIIQNISKATKSSAKNIKNIENMANKSFRNLKNTLTNMRNYKSNPKMQQSLFRQALKEKQIFENFYRQLKTYKNNAGLGQLDTMMNSITNKFSQYQKAALKVEQKIGQSMSESQKFTQRFLVNLEKRGLLRSSKVLRFLKPMEQHVALSKLSEVMRLSKLGIPAAKIATRVILPIGVILDLITIGTAIYGGVQANQAVQEANKNTGLARMKGSGNQIRRILQMDPQRLQSFINTSRPVLQNYARFLNQTDLTQQEKQQFMEILRRNGIPLPTGQDPGSLGGGFWSTVGKSAVDMGKETANNTANWFKKL